MLTVTLELLAQTDDRNVWSFRLAGVPLHCPPFRGMMLRGRRIPRIYHEGRGWDALIHDIGEDLDTGEVVLVIGLVKHVTYTKAEVLEQLGEGWVVSDEPHILADELAQ